MSSLSDSTDLSILGVLDLSVRFGGLSAISNVSLSFSNREIFGLIGPNGAGKTTLVNCLTGFQKPTEGRVVFGTFETNGWDAATFRRNGIARTFQSGRLFSDMTVLENVEVAGVALGLSRKHARSQATELLDWVGLSANTDRPAAILPYTDQRRLSIARALMLSPSFILLDEPAAGMSDHECEELAAMISIVPKNFTCGVLLIEHNMHLVMNVCHRIHVLDGGRSVADGTPSEIQQHQAVLSAYLGAEE